MLWRWEEGGVWPASLTQFPHLQPSPILAPDILTEDDVYCSCLAKTLCHVPVPVTVGFYAHFGCRLHMMLDKITGENLLVLGEERGRETSLWSRCRPSTLTAVGRSREAEGSGMIKAARAREAGPWQRTMSAMTHESPLKTS